MDYRAAVVGAGPDIALDQRGRPHLAFSLTPAFPERDTGGAVAYAWPRRAGWEAVVVEEPGTVVYHPVLALDDHHRPWLAYGCASQHPPDRGCHLHYAHKDRHGWHREVVGPMRSGVPPALRLDATGRPHLAFPGPDSARNTPCYARWTPAGWVIESPAPEVQGDLLVLLALARPDMPHLLYVERGPNVLHDPSWRRSWAVAGTWSHETVAAKGGSFGSLVLDTTLHLVYQQEVIGGGLVYARRDFFRWEHEPITWGEAPSALSTPALAQHPDGRLVLVAQAGPELVLVERRHERWQRHSVITERWQGDFRPRLAVDSRGGYHVVYVQVENETVARVAYAYHDGSTWQHHVVAEYVRGPVIG